MRVATKEIRETPARQAPLDPMASLAPKGSRETLAISAQRVPLDTAARAARVPGAIPVPKARKAQKADKGFKVVPV